MTPKEIGSIWKDQYKDSEWSSQPKKCYGTFIHGLLDKTNELWNKIHSHLWGQRVLCRL